MIGVWVAVGLVWAATLMGCASRWGWLCDLASHFRVQYAWLLGFCAVLFVALHQPLGVVMAAGGLLVNLRFILPVYVRRPSRAHGRTFRGMSVNLWRINRAYEKACRYVRAVNPDFIVFQEVSDEWQVALRELQADYPFSKGANLAGGFGLLLLSRLPIERAEVIPTGVAGLPSIVAHLQLDEHRLTVIGTHPHSPVTPRRMRFRNHHLAHLAEVVLAQRGPVMVLGDFNTTSWTAAFQALLQRAKLQDSRTGFGLQPTWPSFMLFLRIPIDHCLVSSEIVVSQRRVGSYIGSDHYPVIVDFAICEMRAL